MPNYEYRCTKCENQFEIWQEVGAEAPPCPECQSEVKKVFHPIRTIYKGSGFYITDTRSEKGGAASSPAASSSSSSSPSATTTSAEPAKSETSSATSAASTPAAAKTA